MEWPENWDLTTDRHGHRTFSDPSMPFFVHKKNIADPKRYITVKAHGIFEHEFEVDLPQDFCGLEVYADNRCDDARRVLFGDSTSVGQICSIADAVAENGPDNMPGTCCLDNVKTLENFGEKVSARSLVLLDAPPRT